MSRASTPPPGCGETVDGTKLRRFEFLSTKTEGGMPVEPLSSDDLLRAVYELYAVHWGYFNAGFEPDDIFVECATIENGDPPGYYANVVLIQDGERKFVYTAVPLFGESDAPRLDTLWQEFSSKQPQMPRAQLDAIVERSNFRPQLTNFWMALQLKGIRCPLLEDSPYLERPVN